MSKEGREAMTVFTIADTRLTVKTCVTCGVKYALPEELDDRRYLDKEWTYCPNGHQQQYQGKTAEQERDEALAKLHSLQKAADQLADDAMDKAKEIKRLKRHAAAGLCSFCRRHFTNLERHVKSKHKKQAKGA